MALPLLRRLPFWPVKPPPAPLEPQLEEKLLSLLLAHQRIVFAGLGLLLVLLLWVRCRRSPQRRFPRVPGALPLLGNLHQLGGASNLVTMIHQWLDQYAAEDGVVEFNLLGVRYIAVGSHAAALELMRYRPYKLVRTNSIKTLDNMNGLFHSEGQNWRTQRRVFTPAFSHARMQSYLAPIKTVTRRLVEVWRDGPGVDRGQGVVEGQPINDMLFGMTADVTAIIGFGNDLDVLRKASWIIKDIQNIFHMSIVRMLRYRICRYWEYPLGTYLDGTGQSLYRVHRELSKLVAARRMTKQAAEKLGDTGTLLDNMQKRVALGETRESDGSSKFDERTMADNLITAFLAGSDTTGVALSWMLYRLALDPVLQAECAAEAMSFDLDCAEEPEVIAKLPTLQSFYWETNRLNGASGFLPFEPAQDETIRLQGCDILPPSKGGPVEFFMMSTYINRSKAAGELAGISNPEVFDARRWIQPDGTVRTPPADAYFSFGHGMRVCPGREFSRLTSIICLATILREFCLSLPEGHPEVGTITRGTQIPDKDIRLILTPQKRPGAGVRTAI